MKPKLILILLLAISLLVAVSGCGERRYYINYPYKHAVELRPAPREVIYLDWYEPVWLWSPGLTVWWEWWYCDPPGRIIRWCDDPPKKRAPVKVYSPPHRRASLRGKLSSRR